MTGSTIPTREEILPLKPSSLSLPVAATALLIAAVFAAATVAQAPQAPPPPAGGPPHTYPAPTNLKVLPKNLTGQQVHEIMEKWEGSLGVHCNACHAADPNDIGPNGRPRLKFPDDSKPEKNIARTMVTMVEEINKNYISKIDATSGPVTCGTCHRGHMEPEPFVIPDDDAPRPPQAPPPGEGAAPKPQ